MPMNKKNKLQQLEHLIEKALHGQAVEVLWIEYKKAGSDWVLQVYIDAPGGVTFETCSKTSHLILDALEQEDPLGGEYLLEVSSAGVDRPLRNAADFETFCGERVYIKLHKAVSGQKVFTGILLSTNGTICEIENEADKNVYELPLAGMAKATLKPILNFD